MQSWWLKFVLALSKPNSNSIRQGYLPTQNSSTISVYLPCPASINPISYIILKQYYLNAFTDAIMLGFGPQILTTCDPLYAMSYRTAQQKSANYTRDCLLPVMELGLYSRVTGILCGVLWLGPHHQNLTTSGDNFTSRRGMVQQKKNTPPDRIELSTFRFLS